MCAKPPDPVFVLCGANDSITSISFIQPDEEKPIRYLAAGTQTGFIFIWDLKTKGIIHQWNAHDSTSVLWLKSISQNEICSQGRSDGTRFWKIQNNEIKLENSFIIEDYLGFCQNDLINLDREKLLLLSPGPSLDIVSVYDVRSKNKVCSLVYNSTNKVGNIMQAKWIKLGDNIYVLVAYENGSLVLWDWSNKAILNSIDIKENPMCLYFDSETSKGICGTSEVLYTFRISSFAEFENLEKIEAINPGFASCCIRSDGKIFATGGWDHRIRIFSCKKNKPLAVLINHKQTIHCLAFSDHSVEQFPPGMLLAAGSGDQCISLWNLYN